MTVGKVLVTGATGFVGTHVAGALHQRGVAVRALVRRTSDTTTLQRIGAELVTGALDDPAAVRAAVQDVDAVLHLAALTRARTADEYHRVNETGTAILFQALAGTEIQPARAVYLSSLAAAGPCARSPGVGPGDTPVPLTAYGRSKLAGEKIAQAAAAGGRRVAILRAPAVYGPGDRDLYRFFRLAERGFVPVPTGPARPLQLIHVEDLAEALVLAVLTESAEGVVHVAEARVYTWEEVARMVARAVRANARLVPVPPVLIRGAAHISEAAAGLIGRSTIFNADKAEELLAPGWTCETETARRVLGFEARIPLAEGLANTARWYREQGWLRRGASTNGD